LLGPVGWFLLQQQPPTGAFSIFWKAFTSPSFFRNIMYVSTSSAHHTPTIEQQVFRIISKRKAIRASRVRKTASLARDLRFETLDVVDIILELERNFSITIPDEVPLTTVGDFVRYVRDHAAAA
jgi:acyl carrier protein